MGKWLIAKDALHTGLGLALIASQGPWSTHSPSQALLWAGLGLCGSNLAVHVASAFGASGERPGTGGQ